MSSLQVIAAIMIAQSAPASNLRELWTAFHGCFKAPEHTAGSQMTVRFSLTRDGTVQGKPAITFSKLVGTSADQQAFVSAVFDAVTACTPVRLTESFGNAVAGRPISLRFIAKPPETRL